jgi:hypothetical protein
MFSKIVKSLGLIVAISAVTGCVPLDNQYGYGSDPYYPSSGGYYDPPYRDDRREIRRERERLEDERERLERERERLERERQREILRPVPRPPVIQQPERCPSGFSPSEDKCRPEERKRGCKDIRMPSGLGCVRRP